MKILKLLAGSALAFTCLASSASALTFYDLDVIVEKLNTGESYNGDFDINPSGYDPANMQVTSADAYFWLTDDAIGGDAPWWLGGDSEEYVKVSLGGIEWQTEEIDSILFSIDWVSGALSGTLLGALQDGILEYTVTMTQGDAWLKGAKLIAEAEYVPDSGTTLACLGLGLGALAFFRRRR